MKEIGYQGTATDDRKKVVDFLLNLALQYQMEDTRKHGNLCFKLQSFDLFFTTGSQLNLSKKEISDLAKVNTSAANLTQIDVNSAPFIDGLRELSALLDVPFYQEEPLVTLRAISILLRRLKRDTRSPSTSETSSDDGSKKKKLSFKTDDSKLAEPFSKTSKYDPPMNRAANVLRLLYINDLRQLQTAINGMIVQVQSLTANPKTDTKLGKIGRK